MARKLIMTDTISDKTTQIEKEVMSAYADCHDAGASMPWPMGRNLNFKASESVDSEEAMRIMKKAIPHGYNHFSADLLEHLPTGCMVKIARENSVCIYVEFTEEVGRAALWDAASELRSTMGADEFDRIWQWPVATSWDDMDPTVLDNIIVRIWWD